MNSNKKKAPAATGAIKNRKTNHYEGVTLSTIIAQDAQNVEFDTEIRVGNTSMFLDNGTVWMHTSIGALSFSPQVACAVAAALQAIGVYGMEQAESGVTC